MVSLPKTLTMACNLWPDGRFNATDLLLLLKLKPTTLLHPFHASQNILFIIIQYIKQNNAF
jgi:hypothetical protein